MSDESAVLERVDEGVLWLTINRPGAMNALNAAVREGLWAGVRRFVADDDLRVLVLTGAGDRAFCAGADLKEMSGTQMTVPPPDFMPVFGRNVHTDKITIAAVNGLALAGGFSIVQNCDLVVAADTATFGVREAQVGRGAPWAAPLQWLMPPRVALQLLLTGEALTAERAREIGFVNEVVPLAELVDATQRLARRIAMNAPLSVAAMKRTIYAAADRSLLDGLAEGDRIFEPVYLSADAQEGPRAFAEKRPPRWTGR